MPTSPATPGLVALVEGHEKAATAPLASIGPGDSARVVELALDPEVAGWLRAVGVAEGERVTVLRRAAFGGPIHLRTGSGGEFALHRSLASAILTEREPTP